MSRSPAFSRVLYVTNASNDRWFIPTTGYGDNPNAGTTAQQLTQCQTMVSTDSGQSNRQIGLAVKAGTLDTW